MLCPDCGYDNIEGMDNCEQCEQSLVGSQRILIPQSDFEEMIAVIEIGELAPKPPVVLAETATVREAIAAMIDGHFGCVVVETDGKLSGIFTERDVLNKVHGDHDKLDQPISGFMTAGPETVDLDDTVGYTLQAMNLGGYRHVPVVDETGKAVGILSVRDILGFVHRRFDAVQAAG